MAHGRRLLLCGANDIDANGGRCGSTTLGISDNRRGVDCHYPSGFSRLNGAAVSRSVAMADRARLGIVWHISGAVDVDCRDPTWRRVGVCIALPNANSLWGWLGLVVARRTTHRMAVSGSWCSDALSFTRLVNALYFYGRCK